jgi:tetratricopeptide (TPR) repeat protein
MEEKTKKKQIGNDLLFSIAYNKDSFDNIQNHIFIGKVNNIAIDCECIFHHHPDPEIRIEYGIPFLNILHLLDKDEFTQTEEYLLNNLIQENEDSFFRIRNEIISAQINARIYRRRKEFYEAQQLLTFIVNRSKDEKYSRWEFDCYQAELDNIGICQQINRPNIEFIARLDEIIRKITEISNRKINFDNKANLIGEAYSQKANYYSSIGDYLSADKEMVKALELLRSTNNRRALTLRYANRAWFNCLEMKEKNSDKNEIAERVANSLNMSIKIGTLNGRMNIDSTIAVENIKLSLSFFPYLKTGEVPPGLKNFYKWLT